MSDPVPAEVRLRMAREIALDQMESQVMEPESFRSRASLVRELERLHAALFGSRSAADRAVARRCEVSE